MRATAWSLIVMVVGIGAFSPTGAQERDVRRELADRGAPPMFVEPVAAQVEATRSLGLPDGPVIDKALEGWAKRVQVQRVVTALEQIRVRLEAARGALGEAGRSNPPGVLVVGASEALAEGIDPSDVGQIVAEAPDPEAGAAGLMVAASLRAQGLDRLAAVQAVRDGLHRGLGPAQLYELPSAVADLTGRGIAMTDVARRIMEGGGLPLPPAAGSPGQSGGRPGSVPPGAGGQQGQGTTKRRK